MLLHGDCLKLMPTLGDNCVDMVLVDLPYGQIGLCLGLLIDLAEMWVQLKRICKPNANIVFFCTTKFGNKLINSNEKWFRYDLVWEKPNIVGFMNANKQPLRKHEIIYVFGKPSGGSKTYNPQKTTGHKNSGNSEPVKLPLIELYVRNKNKYHLHGKITKWRQTPNINPKVRL
jgi:site-specific DNA-methyltransferase (adenine-specific)